MKRILLYILFMHLILNVNARNKYLAFQAGIEAGISATTIQRYYDYFGFFDDLYYGKDFNGTAGIFVNRFLHPNYQMELGFYLTSKGTRYLIMNKTPNTQGSSGIKPQYLYLEIPIVLYFYPAEQKHFCYRFGVSVAYLLNESFYKDYDTALSFGIRFKPFKTGFLKNDLCMLKADCSLLPISNPSEIENYNEQQKWFYQLNPIQRNMGITLSLQHYLNAVK